MHFHETFLQNYLESPVSITLKSSQTGAGNTPTFHEIRFRTDSEKVPILKHSPYKSHTPRVRGYLLGVGSTYVWSCLHFALSASFFIVFVYWTVTRTQWPLKNMWTRSGLQLQNLSPDDGCHRHRRLATGRQKRPFQVSFCLGRPRAIFLVFWRNSCFVLLNELGLRSYFI